MSIAEYFESAKGRGKDQTIILMRAPTRSHSLRPGHSVRNSYNFPGDILG